MRNIFVLCIALVCCMGLTVYDSYLAGRQQAKEDFRMAAYCQSYGHVETLCEKNG